MLEREDCFDALTGGDLISTFLSWAVLLTFFKGGGLGHAQQRVIKVMATRTPYPNRFSLLVEASCSSSLKLCLVIFAFRNARYSFVSSPDKLPKFHIIELIIFLHSLVSSSCPQHYISSSRSHIHIVHSPRLHIILHHPQLHCNGTTSAGALT